MNPGPLGYFLSLRMYHLIFAHDTDVYFVLVFDNTLEIEYILNDKKSRLDATRNTNKTTGENKTRRDFC